jgi:hypothetical protein
MRSGVAHIPQAEYPESKTTTDEKDVGQMRQGICP